MAGGHVDEADGFVEGGPCPARRRERHKAGTPVSGALRGMDSVGLIGGGAVQSCFSSSWLSELRLCLWSCSSFSILLEIILSMATS